MNMKRHTLAFVVFLCLLLFFPAIWIVYRGWNSVKSAITTRTVVHSSTSAMQKQFADYGSDRGKYDATHGLHDYRSEFRKDPFLAWAYLAYNLNTDGTQDPVGPNLANVSMNLPKYQKQSLIQAFVAAYIKGYEAP